MQNELYEFLTNYEKIHDNIITHTKKYVADHNLKSLVLGISGGIDSTLVAALASEIPVNVIGIVMPIVSNKEDEMKRAEAVAKAFCTEYQYIDMSALYFKTLNFFGLTGETDDPKIAIARGNIKARLRMMKLYDVAGRNGGMVLSTDNLTELLLGFWTLHGDVGDYGMIQQLWKTEVYGLAQHIANKYYAESFKQEIEYVSREKKAYLALQPCIEAMPTDGLGITNSDFDQIMPEYDTKARPMDNYKLVDIQLQQYLGGEMPSDKINQSRVIQRHLTSEYKRNNPFNISRINLM